MAAYETHLWLVTALLTGILIGAAVVQALNAIVKYLRQRRLALEEESLRKQFARDGGHCSHQRDLDCASQIELAGQPSSSHEPVALQDAHHEDRRLLVLADPDADEARHDAEEDALPHGRGHGA